MEIEIPIKLKETIEKNIEAIDQGDYSSLFECAWIWGFNSDQYTQLTNILKILGVSTQQEYDLACESYKYWANELIKVCVDFTSLTHLMYDNIRCNYNLNNETQNRLMAEIFKDPNCPCYIEDSPDGAIIFRKP